MRAAELLFVLSLAACGDVLGLGEFSEQRPEPREDVDVPGAGGAGGTADGGSTPGESASFRILGSPADDELTAFAADDAGNAILAGTIGAAASFGGPLVGSPTRRELFVAGLDASGGHRFSMATTDGVATAHGAALGPGGHAAVVGDTAGPMSIGGASLPGGDADDGFALVVSPTGEVTRLLGFNGFGRQSPRAVAVAPDGMMVVVGVIAGVMAEPAALTGEGGEDAFALAFAPGGQLMWAKRWGDGADQAASAVAFAPDGSLYVAGRFAGALGVASLEAFGAVQAFVIHLDAAGNELGATAIGSMGAAAATALALGDELFVGGAFSGPVSFGTGDEPISAGGRDGFVVALDATSLEPQWSWGFGGAGEEAIFDLGARGARLVVGARYASCPAFIGDDELSCGGEGDALAVALDGDIPSTVVAFGRQEDDFVRGVWRGSDRFVAAGTFGDIIEVAGELHHASGGTDLFLLTVSD
jgi:hypothetical protein